MTTTDDLKKMINQYLQQNDPNGVALYGDSVVLLEKYDASFDKHDGTFIIQFEGQVVKDSE